jgi:hypothetical protein
LGEFSSDGLVSKGALTYALGSNGGYALKNDLVIYIKINIYIYNYI